MSVNEQNVSITDAKRTEPPPADLTALTLNFLKRSSGNSLDVWSPLNVFALPVYHLQMWKETLQKMSQEGERWILLKLWHEDMGKRRENNTRQTEQSRILGAKAKANLRISTVLGGCLKFMCQDHAGPASHPHILSSSSSLKPPQSCLPSLANYQVCCLFLTAAC